MSDVTKPESGNTFTTIWPPSWKNDMTSHLFCGMKHEKQYT